MDENEGILLGQDRKMRKQLFRAIQDGALDYDEYEEMMGKPASMFFPHMHQLWDR